MLPVPVFRELDRTLFVLALLPPLFWAGNFVVAGAMRDTIPPVQMSFYRWVLASAFMVPFAATTLWRERAILRRELPWLALLAAIGVTAFNSLIYVALGHTEVVSAAILNTTMPVLTFLLAFLVLGQRLSGRQALGAGVALVGALVVAVRGEPSRLLSLAFNGGDILVLCGVGAWAFYTVLLRHRPSKLRPSGFLLATFALGTLFHLPFVVWEFGAKGGFELDAQAMASLLYLAIFPSILAYVLWSRTIAALGPSRTAVFMYAMPVFTAILASAVLGERLQSFHAVGGVMIVIGITLVTRLHPQRVAPATGR